MGAKSGKWISKSLLVGDKRSDDISKDMGGVRSPTERKNGLDCKFVCGL